MSGPIHYDFLLPADDATREMFDFARNAGVPLDHPGVDWIVVGWGAHGFYTETGGYRDVSVGTVWKAVTGDSAVLHVSVAGPLGDMKTREIRLTEEEYARLITAIRQSVAASPKDIGISFGEWDRFFPAKGRFHILNTCNVWVARMMRQAGLRFGRWTPTPFAVSISAKLYQ